MVMRIGSPFWLFTCLAVALILLPGRPTRAEHVTREQLRSLMPDEADLPGFLRLQLSQFKPSQDPTGADSDFVRLNHDVTEWMPGRRSTPAETGTVSVISRNFVSRDGCFTLTVDVTLCDTPGAAAEEVTNFRRGAQSGLWPGTLSGGPRIGDESWHSPRNTLLCRQGRMMVFVSGDTTPRADKQQNVSGFPIPALEAVAYQVLLRASHQSALTGVPAQSATPAANSHALPENALMVAGRVYVPVQEFAKAMKQASRFANQAADAQGLTREQLQALAPDEQDLQGFIRVLPGSDSPSLLNSGNATASPPVPAQPVNDAIFLRDDPASSTPWFGRFSETTSVGAIRRLFQYTIGTFILDVEVTLCDSPEVAHEQLTHLHSTELLWRSGCLTSPETIGDESFAPVTNGRFKTLAFRYGSLLAVIDGSRSNRSFMFNRALTIQTMPPAAVEAVAYEILLRASQEAKLVSAPAQNTHLAVNNHVLSKNALMVGRQTYVPVREFAKAMGMTSGWDAKTGALTLAGPKRKTVALTAGSTAATVGGAKASALSVPVLKDGGEPVMALSDLLTLTGGRVTGHAGNTVQVKG